VSPSLRSLTYFFEVLMLTNSLENSFRSYVEKTLLPLVVKTSRIGSVFPLSFCKATMENDAVVFTDITNDDEERLTLGREALGYGMYSSDDCAKFEEATLEVGGTVGIVFIQPVEFFEDSYEKIEGMQHYILGYYGIRNGVPFGHTRKLTMVLQDVDPVQDASLLYNVYQEYLNQFQENQAKNMSDEEAREAFERDVWSVLKPVVWATPSLCFLWEPADMADCPYKEGV
jgi:hypothetical protein